MHFDPDSHGTSFRESLKVSMEHPAGERRHQPERRISSFRRGCYHLMDDFRPQVRVAFAVLSVLALVAAFWAVYKVWPH